jgi:aspartate/methionine/tyrosine aminotransferase
MPATLRRISTMIRQPSNYLNWYVQVPKISHDLRSSGITKSTWKPNLGEVNFTTNYAHGNPEALRLLAERYKVKPENIFISSDGASGQNTRILELLSSRKYKTEAIMEYPTYEPMLRQAQSYFRQIKRIERKEENNYKFDLGELEKTVSDKTAALVITNTHAPSGISFSTTELREILDVARSHDCYVVCDEIYAEFDRAINPHMFSVDKEYAIVTTSFSKAYGLGGLKAGFAIASKTIIDELYMNVLNTSGTNSNLVELALIDLLTKGKQALEEHKGKWLKLRQKTEEWLKETGFLSYTANECGVVYWVETQLKDTYRWVNKLCIPKFSLATVPGAFFLFKKHEINTSNKLRLGIGAINPEKPEALDKTLQNLEKAVLRGMKLGF